MDSGYVCIHKGNGATGAPDYPIADCNSSKTVCAKDLTNSYAARVVVLLQDSSNLVLRTELLLIAGAH